MALRLILLFLSILSTLVIPGTTNAQIYKFTDKLGVQHFTNVPNDSKFREFSLTDFRVKIDTYKHRRYDHIINWAAGKYGLHSALIKAIIRVESDFNPWAVSRKGARGLMQLMPGTIMRMAVKNPFDPRENIHAGVRLFRHLLSKLDGDIVLALAAYNAGLTTVQRYNKVPPYAETARFVKKVLHFYNHYQ